MAAQKTYWETVAACWEPWMPDWTLVRYVPDAARKARIFVWWAAQKPLTPKQRRALEQIADVLRDGLDPVDGEVFEEACRRYEKRLLTAERLELGAHPLIWEYVTQLRCLGHRNVLHRLSNSSSNAKRFSHLEQGVEAPLSMLDAALLWAVDDMRQHGTVSPGKGKDWTRIWKCARNLGLLKKPAKKKEPCPALHALITEIMRLRFPPPEEDPSGSGRYKEREGVPGRNVLHQTAALRAALPASLVERYADAKCPENSLKRWVNNFDRKRKGGPTYLEELRCIQQDMEPLTPRFRASS